MTPYNFVNMANIIGLGVVALTDHNTCLNCPAAVKAGEAAGLTVIPGMELCTSEEVHVICLLPDLERALAFSDHVRKTMPPVKNREDIFGEQLIMDETDHVIGKEELLLTTASGIGLYQVVPLIREYGGCAFPAHINRASYSVIANLGGISADMGFCCAELTTDAPTAEYLEKYPVLREMQLLYNSDAHSLEAMNFDPKHLPLPACDIETVLNFINLGGFSENS